MFSQVAALQTKLKDKENELKNILLEFSASQKSCTQLEEKTSKFAILHFKDVLAYIDYFFQH